MLEQPTEPDEETQPQKTLSRQLVLVFCWSVGIGTVSPVIVAFFMEHWSLIPDAALLGACFGCIWGILAAVPLAIAGSRYRETIAIWMFVILSILVMIATWFVIRVGDG